MMHQRMVLAGIGCIAVIVCIVLGVAIQHVVGDLPKMDAQIGRVHIVASHTTAPECPPSFCPPNEGRPSHMYYVFWYITDQSVDDQFYRRYRQVARRVFVIRLKR